MQERFEQLRNEHRLFIYDGFKLEDEGSFLHITYRFDIPSLCSFQPEWRFPKSVSVKPDDTLRAMCFSLGMAELVSYWKCCCPPAVEVRCGALDEQQIGWWKKLWFNGLGEFFYLNGISCTSDDFMTLTADGPDFETTVSSGEGFLAPVGGGKDSAVTLELLKRTGETVTCFTVNPRKATRDTCQRSGLGKGCEVSRTLDKRLLELNSRGFLNGHTPFSSVVAFASLIAARLCGRRYIALSNESSANEPTTVSGANHQYSKSFEFESDFRQYAAKLDGGIEYFSLLRPLSEYQITKLFSRYQYLDVFRSCNAGSKTDSWCGKCPKCLFVAIMLSAFLDRRAITGIFGTDILDDSSLISTLDKLTGLDPEKPFECVGSRSEAVFALRKASERYGDDAPALIKHFRSSIVSAAVTEDFDKYFDHANALPERLLHLVAAESLEFDDFIKAVFRNKKTALLGFGREGRSTASLLGRLGLDYTPVDDKKAADAEGIYGKDCQDFIDTFDLAVKSPGVVLRRDMDAFDCSFTSQTELFLEKYRDNTIGVTGTKGKSTTASLIYHALNQSGVDTVFAGNIGVPPLEIAERMRAGTVAVIELSSHQLEYTRVSPHIGLYLNLFPEHLDHYASFEHYKAAKENIYRNMMTGDLLICDKNLVPASGCRADVISLGTAENGFDDNCIIVNSVKYPLTGSPLEGRHNRFNICAALAACMRFITPESFFEALKTFQPLPHRMQNIGTFDGITYYDDSISTIGAACISAIESLHPETVLIGGMDRGIPYDDLIAYLRSSYTGTVILMGSTGKRIYDTAGDSLGSHTLLTGTLAEAVSAAKRLTPHGGRCLLSPAAASYDEFKNFEERGNAFAALASSHG